MYMYMYIQRLRKVNFFSGNNVTVFHVWNVEPAVYVIRIYTCTCT